MAREIYQFWGLFAVCFHAGRKYSLWFSVPNFLCMSHMNLSMCSIKHFGIRAKSLAVQEFLHRSVLLFYSLQYLV